VTKRNGNWVLTGLLPVFGALLLACSQQQGATGSPAASSQLEGAPVIVLETSLGTIRVELDAEKAPQTVDNFLQYVDSGHYDGTVFHRVIPGFMVQGGGFDAELKQKPTREGIQNEAANGLLNDRGTLAMARTSDPHSASAQFFINVVDNDFLNHTAPDARGYGYAVFGKVTDGMDVVEEIVGVPTGNQGGHQNVPLEPVVLVSAKRAE
jgi:peptidyl-prolyl cis-trans isomerase B (cyclophilin B)